MEQLALALISGLTIFVVLFVCRMYRNEKHTDKIIKQIRDSEERLNGRLERAEMLQDAISRIVHSLERNTSKKPQEPIPIPVISKPKPKYKPKGRARSVMTEDVVNTIKVLRTDGLSHAQIQKILKIGVGTYYAALKKYNIDLK